MKLQFLIISLLMVSACSKDDNDDNSPPQTTEDRGACYYLGDILSPPGSEGPQSIGYLCKDGKSQNNPYLTFGKQWCDSFGNGGTYLAGGCSPGYIASCTWIKGELVSKERLYMTEESKNVGVENQKAAFESYCKNTNGTLNLFQ